MRPHASLRLMYRSARRTRTLGCNLAWGLVDAVMYLLRTLTERTRNRTLARQVMGAGTEAAHRLIEQALPTHVIAMTGPEELEGMRLALLALPPPARLALRRDDYLAAAGIFLLVVLATFPVVLPFMLVSEVAKAMLMSQIVTMALLFLAGLALGRY